MKIPGAVIRRRLMFVFFRRWQLILQHGSNFLVAVGFSLWAGLTVGICHQAVAQIDGGTSQSDISPGEIGKVVMRAFKSTHEGFSSDEVILQDELNRNFLAECLRQAPQASPAILNWTLLNLRKAGKLSKVPTTRRARGDTVGVTHVAEIVTRSVQDKHSVTVDKIMTDPQLRQRFDQLARKFDPQVELYLVRKSAFQLRKSRRLKPELVTRVADWQRKISEYSIEEIRNNPELVPELPGIYIFRDSTGYLYIGQSRNLRVRLRNHLDQADNRGLANYLADSGGSNLSIEIHSFPKDSRANESVVRRAYESELIRSRQPRFNILP